MSAKLVVTGGALVAILVATWALWNLWAQPQAVELTTPYQAVVLTSGHAFIGKLEKAGSRYPVLKDVYYIQSAVNQETKEVSRTLVKRGKEWHGPDETILNATHILFIEPVKPDSTVGKLIEESKKQR